MEMEEAEAEDAEDSGVEEAGEHLAMGAAEVLARATAIAEDEGGMTQAQLEEGWAMTQLEKESEEGQAMTELEGSEGAEEGGFEYGLTQPEPARAIEGPACGEETGGEAAGGEAAGGEAGGERSDASVDSDKAPRGASAAATDPASVGAASGAPPPEPAGSPGAAAVQFGFSAGRGTGKRQRPEEWLVSAAAGARSLFSRRVSE